MKTCETCINNGAKCVTMTKPDSLHRCYMTKESAMQAEADIIAYITLMREREVCDSESYMRLSGGIRRARGRMERLEEKQI